MTTNARRWAVWVVVAAAAVSGLCACLAKEVSELPVYVLGAERMLAGAEIYRTADAKPFTYPPFFALPFVPLVGLPVPWQRGLFYVLTLAALGLALRTLAHVVAPELGTRRARVCFWLVLALVCARHVLAVFENQSHDMLVLWCTVAAAAAWARAESLRAGAWAGLGAACKATPALFAVPFVLRGSWRAACGAAVVGMAATLLPDLVLPRADGRLWVMAWLDTMVKSVRPGAAADLAGTWTAGSILNQALSGTLYRLTTPVRGTPTSPWEVDGAIFDLSPASRRVVILAAQGLVLAAIAATVWWSRRIVDERARLARLAQGAAVACGMVLLSPMSSKSHFGVLLLPTAVGLAVVLRRDDAPRPHRLATGGAWLLLAAMFVVGTLSSKGIVGTRRGNQLLAYGMVTWAAALGLVLCVLVTLVLRARSRAPASIPPTPAPTLPA